MDTISALIITFNEEENIVDCLESVKWCDEIVIVDSFSEDKTVELASQYTEKVYLHKFDNFASQRNYALEKVESDWVLVIDADERVTEELKVEISDVLSSDNSVQAYEIPRKNYFLGKWVKYCGWYPDYTLRLFKNNQQLKYKGKVHENIRTDMKVRNMESPLIHYTYQDLTDYLEKINNYTTLWAEEKHRKGKQTSMLYILLRSMFEFIQKYFFRKGFLLGSQGLILSCILTYYVFLKYVKLWEIDNID